MPRGFVVTLLCDNRSTTTGPNRISPTVFVSSLRVPPPSSPERAFYRGWKSKDHQVIVAAAAPSVLNSALNMAASKTSKKQTKADSFVASRRRTRAVEAIEKAKAAGRNLSKISIQKMRTRSRVKSWTKAAAKAAKPTATSMSKEPTTSKADFVRSHGGPSHKEVVAKAKTAEISITETRVYSLRAACKKASEKKAAMQTTTSKPRATNRSAVSAAANEEEPQDDRRRGRPAHGARPRGGAGTGAGRDRRRVTS